MSQGAGPKSRGLLSAIWNNFRKSLSVASAEEGAIVGRDPFGNTFYEIPADPRWVQYSVSCMQGTHLINTVTPKSKLHVRDCLLVNRC